MARIGTSRDKSKPPKLGRQLAPVSESVWLGMGLGGLVFAIAAPADAGWLLQPAAIVVSGIGLYGLGRAHGQSHPDPAARGRVSQLERAFTQLALMAGYDGLARRSDPSSSGAPSTEPIEDAGAERRKRPAPSGGRPGAPATDVGLTETG